MSVVLVTGMSGTGKSTTLAELARRGHRVVETDRPPWSEEVTDQDGAPAQVWREEALRALLDGHRDGWLFLAGCVSNQGRFYDRFAAVVLLSAPRDVLLDRLATRSTNPFGSTEAERDRVLADRDAVEPLLRATSTLEVVTTAPPADIADALEAVARRALCTPRPVRTSGG